MVSEVIQVVNGCIEKAGFGPPFYFEMLSG